MKDLFRNTTFGILLRVITRGKVLQYDEEKDPSIWKRYLAPELSAHMATHGNLGGDADEGVLRKESGNFSNGNRTSSDSSRIRIPENTPINETSGVPVDPEKGRDVNVNPQNWSSGKKAFISFQICLLTFSVYIGSAIYSAGIEDVMRDFRVSQVAATLGLTLFVLGYGIGPMLWAPMSEMPAIGRNPVYIGTLTLFVILQVPTALSVNLGMLLAFRFITGFVGSPPLANGGATISDIYPPKQRAYAMAVWGVGAVCGPVMGPLIGGFAAQAKGWRWTIWELTWLSSFSLVFLFFFFPETSPANILYRRAHRLRKLTGNPSLKSEAEIAAEQFTPREIALMVLVRPFTLNFQEPIVLALNLYIALIYGLLYIWFESFPLVFIGIYHFNLGQLGLAFIGILVGALLTLPFMVWYLAAKQVKYFNEKGEIKPEKRLQIAMVGAFAIPICLFWFGWSARPSIHWIMPIIGSGWFSVGAFLLFNAILNYLADAYPDYAASVLAGNDFMRSCVGAAFPLFATAMYKNLGINWASTLLALLSCVFIPIPFALYFYGERIRHASKLARHDL
ncbi:putative caffeine resistance protein 5 [Xylona heveae TC161]|uniref:Putative caffeine resistance protein 5 n=1 Tax=Xylona heveae (strain CBS 132557 / TC161) TaxID=1328760 RepID=A0A165JMP0_XYLHT|nr:putative caffeine resistance protein 5 [Xylona heveae TC161]KZF26428.1 putative caffeine resistance protein 5 [Xylona heveae TC161]